VRLPRTLDGLIAQYFDEGVKAEDLISEIIPMMKPDLYVNSVCDIEWLIIKLATLQAENTRMTGEVEELRREKQVAEQAISLSVEFYTDIHDEWQAIDCRECPIERPSDGCCHCWLAYCYAIAEAEEGESNAKNGYSESQELDT
jgi:hypothetical protein